VQVFTFFEVSLHSGTLELPSILELVSVGSRLGSVLALPKLLDRNISFQSPSSNFAIFATLELFGTSCSYISGRVTISVLHLELNKTGPI
jgi:hypothetical protein